ncbi:DUF6441 family protein [uncultured Marinobacter sp.]|uniref:DUF6441 family protein n=1 Tax=uncultured Marinobacter sp. TaxID=187379 RepID=UPI0030DB2796
MRISLTGDGLLDRRRFRSWRGQTQRKMRDAASRAMRGVGREIAESVRQDMRAGLRVKKASFLKSMRAKVYNQRRDRFPALYIGSKIPWLGLHEKGGVISGRMLIPLLPQHQRLGRKAFRRVIDALMRSGNAFFIQRNGKAILMAENIRENDRALARFKRGERLRSGQKRLRRGQEIPIAVLVDRIRLRSRFNIESSVRRKLPRLARAIQREINR